MFLIPFGFLSASGSVSIPINTAPPQITLLNAETGLVEYTTPGTWTDADTITFAWFVNGFVVLGETSDQIAINYGDSVTLIETANNVIGSDEASSNTIIISLPDHIEEGAINWTLEGEMIEPLVVNEAGEITWEVFGSVV